MHFDKLYIALHLNINIPVPQPISIRLVPFFIFAKSVRRMESIVKENFEIDEKELSSDLKPIIRLADSADDYIYMENKKKAKE